MIKNECRIDGCGISKGRLKLGLCPKHYVRQYRHGDFNTHFHIKYNTPEEKKLGRKLTQKSYSNTVKGKITSKRKRHKRRGSECHLDPHDYNLICEYFNNKCFKCGTSKDITFDHNIPVIHGGHLSIDNTVLLCRVCNGKKSGQLPNDFYSEDELKLLDFILWMIKKEKAP